MRRQAGSLLEEGANSWHSPLLISIVVTVSIRSATPDRSLMLRGPVGHFFHRPNVFHISDLVL